MQSGQSMTLLEAIAEYTGSIKAEDNDEELQRELQRFADWGGRNRTLSEISPPEIGEYADQLAGTGTTPQAAERLQIIRGFLAYARKRGLVDTNLAQHVRVRKSRTRTRRSGVTEAPQSAPLTRGGHAELLAQLEKLRAERASLALQIRKAAADKDVRENAPLEAAREQSGQIESRIRSLEETLNSAVILDSSQKETVTVRLGVRVSVNDLTAGRRTTYTLVHRSEANPLEGRISDVSPLGKALMGCSAGQEVEVETPRGRTRYRVLKVSS